MREIWKMIQITIASVGAWFGWFLGGYDGLIFALVVFVTTDYITGVMRVFIERRLSSEIGATGILKKVFIFTLVGVGHIVDIQILDGGGAIRTAVIFFYLSNEGISILENAVVIGLPIPERLCMVLKQLSSGGDEDEPK